MQPQNVMKNMTTPTTIKMTAGSMRNVSRTVSGEHEHNSPRSDLCSTLCPAPAPCFPSLHILINLLRLMQDTEV